MAQLSPSRLRERILSMAFRGQTVHIPCAFSVVEVLACLYSSFITDPLEPKGRLILSKGHGVMALYACLAELGVLKEEHLDRYFQDGSLLRGLCEADVPGCEVTSGSLGHGVSIAAGIALGAKRLSRDESIYCIVGDGEANEGPVWETALFVAHHGLDNFYLIVDANGFQAMGKTQEVLALEPLPEKFQSFGFAALECDGHDLNDISQAVSRLSDVAGKPKAIIARTTKGKGVSFMENDNRWHYTRLNAETYARAMRELNGSQS